MKKDVKQILEEFVKECSKKLKLATIIQFGSSTYTDDFDDVDLLFIPEKAVVPTQNILSLLSIMKSFENNYGEIVFDFGGVDTRKRKGRFFITVIFLSKKEMEVQYNPNDKFLLQSLILDKNKRILYGNDVLEGKSFELNNRQLFELLVVEVKLALRKSLDDLETKKLAIRRLFKTFLRAMLINEGNFKKEELLSKFKYKFCDEIKLPKNSEKIINKNITEKDFEDILKFTEDCLRYLVK